MTTIEELTELQYLINAAQFRIQELLVKEEPKKKTLQDVLEELDIFKDRLYENIDYFSFLDKQETQRKLDNLAKEVRFPDEASIVSFANFNRGFYGQCGQNRTYFYPRR